jgi:hypothetical protein
LADNKFDSFILRLKVKDCLDPLIGVSQALLLPGQRAKRDEEVITFRLKRGVLSLEMIDYFRIWDSAKYTRDCDKKAYEIQALMRYKEALEILQNVVTGETSIAEDEALLGTSKGPLLAAIRYRLGRK